MQKEGKPCYFEFWVTFLIPWTAEDCRIVNLFPLLQYFGSCTTWTISFTHLVRSRRSRSTARKLLRAFFSRLRIQLPPIHSRYYVQRARRDICDSPTKIPYWWHKSVLNPDRSPDWLTDQFWIISSIIIQCCDVRNSQPIWLLMVRIYLVLSGKFLDSAFNLFVQCLMFHC